MKIGLFTDAYQPAISGVVTSVQSLKEGLESLGHTVIVVTTNPTRKEKNKVNFEAEKGKVIRYKGFTVPKKSLRSYKLSPFLHSKLHALSLHNFDVIHVHTEFTMGRLGCLLSRRYNIPMVYTFHTMYEDYFHFISKFLSRFCRPLMLRALMKVITYYLKQAKAVILPTEKVHRVFQRYGFESYPIHVIPTGIDIERFYRVNVDLEQVYQTKALLKIKNDEFCFLFLGRISNEKAIDVVVKEFAKIIPNYSAKLLIVGDGPATNELKKLVEELQITDSVIFTGMISWEQVPIYYQMADVFVNASQSETQGLTYVEALASGLPVIVYEDLATCDYILHEKNGLVAKQNEDFSKHMLTLLNNRQLYKCLEKNASKSVEKYSKSCYTNSVLKIYENIHKEG